VIDRFDSIFMSSMEDTKFKSWDCSKLESMVGALLLHLGTLDIFLGKHGMRVGWRLKMTITLLHWVHSD